jgi:hypothetical protein
MLFNLNSDPADHSTCALSYEETEGWLQATWRGYVDPAEAMKGAAAYLRYAAHTPARTCSTTTRNCKARGSKA